MTEEAGGLAWPDLVDAATVGLTRRPLRAAGGTGRAAGAGGAGAGGAGVRLDGVAGRYSEVLDAVDPAGAVLDAAALVSAARRAGAAVAEGVRGPVLAEPDTGPELPRRAAGVLRRTMAAEPGVLADLLAAAAERGYRVPAPMLPDLLDLGVRDVSLRAAVAGVLGMRGRWLAEYRPDWQRVAAAGLARAGAAPAAEAWEPGVWETGRAAERVGYLAQLRARDPAAARDLLVAGWARETGDDRAALLAVLAAGLGPDDEDFLNAALVDRKGAVRDEAVRLLTRLPGSAFSRQVAERAAGALRLERAALRRRLVAEALDEVTLGQVVGAAPLGMWEERFGLAPAQIVGLPVVGATAAAVQAGWRAAAVREANPAWSEALLAAGPEALAAAGAGGPAGAHRTGGPAGAGGIGGVGRTGGAGGAGGASGVGGASGWRNPAQWRRPPGWPEDAELAAVLPPEARAARGTALLKEVATGRTALTGAAGQAAVTEVAGYPGPWPGELAAAVLAVLRRGIAAGPGRWSGPLLAAAARHLPVAGPDDYAATLTELADDSPPIWSAPLRRAAGAVVARRTFLEEIR